MKRNAAFVQIGCTLLIAIVSSGCATKTIVTAGNTTSTTSGPAGIIVAEDGSVAVKVLSGPPGKKVQSFVVAERPAVEAAVRENPEWQMHTKRFYRPGPYRPMWRGTSDVVRLYWGASSKGWHDMEEEIRDSDAERQLPKQFRQNTSSYSPDARIPYEVDGNNVQIQFHTNNYSKTEKAWWGYPLLVFVPPAFVCDLMWIPPLWEDLHNSTEGMFTYEAPWDVF